MRTKEDKNTRYYIDLDLKHQKIIEWNFDHKDRLAAAKLEKPYYHRIFISRGQYNKLDQKQMGF